MSRNADFYVTGGQEVFRAKQATPYANMTADRKSMTPVSHPAGKPWGAGQRPAMKWLFFRCLLAYTQRGQLDTTRTMTNR